MQDVSGALACGKAMRRFEAASEERASVERRHVGRACVSACRRGLCEGSVSGTERGNEWN